MRRIGEPGNGLDAAALGWSRIDQRARRHRTRFSAIDELTREAQRVFHDGAPVEKTLETRPGVWYLLRVSPYQRAGTSDLGVVITFVNVSALKQAEQDLGKSRENEKK